MSQPARVLVVDDEPHARGGIRALLRKRPEYTVAGECGDGASAVRAIAELRPDLILLDVQMPEMSGIDVVRAVGPDRMPHVVFITAFEQYAIDAFTVSALDYLVKPFHDRRFFDALERVSRTMQDERDGVFARRLVGLLSDVPRTTIPARQPMANAGPILSRLVARSGGRTVVIRTDDIDWIEGAAYHARVHAGARSHLIRETLGNLEKQLDPARFARAHRSAIVNFDRVTSIETLGHGARALVLRDGTRIRLSGGRWLDLADRLRHAALR